MFSNLRYVEMKASRLMWPRIILEVRNKIVDM